MDSGNDLRYALIPYLMETAAASINGGFSVMKALAVAFPDDHFRGLGLTELGRLCGLN